MSKVPGKILYLIEIPIYIKKTKEKIGIYIQNDASKLRDGYKKKIVFENNEIYYELDYFKKLLMSGSIVSTKILFGDYNTLIYSEELDVLFENTHLFLFQTVFNSLFTRINKLKKHIGFIAYSTYIKKEEIPKEVEYAKIYSAKREKYETLNKFLNQAIIYNGNIYKKRLSLHKIQDVKNAFILKKNKKEIGVVNENGKLLIKKAIPLYEAKEAIGIVLFNNNAYKKHIKRINNTVNINKYSIIKKTTDGVYTDKNLMSELLELSILLWHLAGLRKIKTKFFTSNIFMTILNSIDTYSFDYKQMLKKCKKYTDRAANAIKIKKYLFKEKNTFLINELFIKIKEKYYELEGITL